MIFETPPDEILYFYIFWNDAKSRTIPDKSGNHLWKRLAPGRLYDVPVKMGWLHEPLTVDRLNPFPMWM